jgi:predicted metal-dependent phosphoesterase TrpH
MEPMGLADLHMHTLYSWDGTSTVAAILKQALEHTNLDVIAITDHDCLTGALEALELAPVYGIDVIPGCEISTAQGHLLAYFINQPVPGGLSLTETVLRVGELGGLCVAAHPSAWMSNSLHPQIIRDALADPDVARVLIGIEVHNAGLVHKASNKMAKLLANSLPVAQLGNSDAHLLWMIGKATTYFPGCTAEGLRRALENRTTRAIVGPPAQPVRIVGHWLTRYLLRRVGWVAWNAGPQYPIQFGRPAPIELPGSLVNSHR